MRAPSSDKILIVAALVLVLLSGGAFTALSMRYKRAQSGPPPTVELAQAPYTSVAPDAPPVKTDTWAAPVAQSRGDKWIYDAFTPPEIFYNSKSKQFTVKPPTGLGDDEPTEEFGVELAAVKPEPFRLQLIGFAGEGAQARGMFQNVATTEVFLAAAGYRVSSLGVTIRRFEVARQTVAFPESVSSLQRIATAVVHDDRANRDVTLTHRDRVFTGLLFAMIAPTGQSALREVREGDTFKLGDASYRIDKVTLTPPSIDITKESPQLTQPDHRQLSPREIESTDAAEPAAR